MTWLDYAVIGVIVASVGWGIWRGLVREIMSLAGWVIAFLAANLFAAPLAEALPRAISRPEWRTFVAFILIFLVVLVITTLGAVWLSKLVHSVGLGSLDRVLGALFGLLRGLLVVLAFAIAAGLTGFPHRPIWKESVCSAQLVAAANALKPWLPPALGERMKYN